MKLEEFYTQYNELVYNIILKKCGNPELSQDITQQTFVKAESALRRGLYKDNKPASWIVMIAFNTFRDYRRKRRQMETVNIIDDEEYYFILEQQEPESVPIALLDKLIHNIPDNQQYVVRRRLLGVTFSDIALELGVSINTVLGRQRYAVLNMRKFVDKHNLVF